MLRTLPLPNPLPNADVRRGPTPLCRWLWPPLRLLVVAVEAKAAVEAWMGVAWVVVVVVGVGLPHLAGAVAALVVVAVVAAVVAVAVVVGEAVAVVAAWA